MGSTYYSKGIDMWSAGVILGELLGGSPMFPGKSTVHQLELIMEVTGRPGASDLRSIRSKHTMTLLGALAVKPQRSLASLYPSAPPDALDLLSKLLVFAPERRLKVDEAIRHPYLSRFHNSADEPTLRAPIAISIDDNKRFSISEYRKYLYRKIVERKMQIRTKRAETQQQQQQQQQQMSMSQSTGSIGSAPQLQQSQQQSQQPPYRPQSQQQPYQQQQRGPAGSPTQPARPASMQQPSRPQQQQQQQQSSIQQPGYNGPQAHNLQQQQQQRPFSQQQPQRPPQHDAYQTTSGSAYQQPQYNVQGHAQNALNAVAAGQRRR